MKSLVLAALAVALLSACAPRAEKTVAAIDPKTPPAAPAATSQGQTLDQMLDRARARFTRADLNQDGKVTTEEIEQIRSERDDAGPRHIGDDRLMRADTDIDGEITLADVEAHARRRFANRNGAMAGEKMRPFPQPSN